MISFVCVCDCVCLCVVQGLFCSGSSYREDLYHKRRLPRRVAPNADDYLSLRVQVPKLKVSTQNHS